MTYTHFHRDENNGAGLYAVFVGNMPVHHFNTTNLEKVRKYRERLEAAIASVISTCDHDFVNLIGGPACRKCGWTP